MNFKQWLEEYEVPDESIMDRIRNTPLRCDNPPHLYYDYFTFRMPLGNTQHFLIKRNSVVGLKAAPGSLNSRCFNLVHNNKCNELHKLLLFVKNNNNTRIRQQLVGYKND
jgi:hypothetical protein